MIHSMLQPERIQELPFNLKILKIPLAGISVWDYTVKT